MALSNYTDLLASVASWMNRTDLATVIPDFVTIAESKIARELRLRTQLTTTTLTTSTTTRAVTLPADWLEFENVSIAGTPETPCQYVNIEHMDVKYPENGNSGRPFVFTIEGPSILFGPTPDSAYTVNVMYYARFGALATSSTNWLMTNHPNVYLYACLREGAFFTKDAAGAAQWDGLFKQEVNTLQDADDKATHSGSVLRVKSI
jgi:hypothetical protein